MENEEKKTRENSLYKSKIFEEEKYESVAKPFVDLFKEHLPKQIVLISIIVVLIIFLFSNLKAIGDFIIKVLTILIPVILGWALTFAMAPLYNRLVKIFSNNENKKLKKFAKFCASAICIVVLLGGTVGLMFLLVPQLYQSITRFLSRADTYEVLIKDLIEDLRANSGDAVKNYLPNAEDVQQNFNKIFEKFDLSKFASGIYNGVYVSFKAILNFFIAVVVMIYTLNMKKEFSMSLKKILFALFRKDIAQKVLVEVRFAKTVFTDFLIGKFLDSLIIGIICYVCCAIMQMPYTPLIAVIVGVTNIIPFFGPFIGAIPSFVIILLEGPFSWKPYMFLVFILVLQQIDGNIIGPKILGDRTGVGSFWVLFSILLFGGLFGFVGMIIAVPTWAVITRLFNEFVLMQLEKKDYPLSSEEYYELKALNEALKDTKKD